MVETVRGAVVALAVVALSAVPIVTPTATVHPARTACEWLPDLLPLPANTSEGRVTAGAGTWLAGVADGPEDTDPDQGVLWRNGRVKALGHAFGLDTTLHGVNPAGVAVGSVTGPDQEPHAIRHRDGRYEYLPETAGRSVALDINAQGEITGYDGPTLVVWPPAGPPRALPIPPGSTPFGTPAIDDDGTVVARTAHLENGSLTWQGQTWTRDGARTPFPPGTQPTTVADIRNGQVVGASTREPDATTATSWHLESPNTHDTTSDAADGALDADRGAIGRSDGLSGVGDGYGFGFGSGWDGVLGADRGGSGRSGGVPRVGEGFGGGSDGVWGVGRGGVGWLGGVSGVGEGSGSGFGGGWDGALDADPGGTERFDGTPRFGEGFGFGPWGDSGGRFGTGRVIARPDGVPGVGGASGSEPSHGLGVGGPALPPVVAPRAGGDHDDGAGPRGLLASHRERSARVFLGGASAVAVNRAGVVVGVDAAGEPLLWDGLVPVGLAAPDGYHPGSVAAMNDHEAGGFVSPEADFGTVPARWRCR